MMTIGTILVPTDFSDRSEFAYKLACSLARDHGAQLIVLHAWTRPMYIYGEGELATDRIDYRREAEIKMATLIPPDPVVRVQYRLVEGDAIRTILHEAEQCHADMIVMGMHGRTGLRRMLMGSTAEQVLRRAPCPVVTVKDPFLIHERPESNQVEMGHLQNPQFVVV